MIRTVKPRNARSKRAMDERESKLVENHKKTLLLSGTSTSEITRNALGDLHAFKKPHSIKFTKKNTVHPFEDATPLEFFSTKNDTSHIVLGSHSKKRPHTLTFARTFDHKILDMLELHIDAGTFLPLAAFKGEKFAVGLKPMVCFSGSVFEAVDEYRLVKSIFLDFFRGETVAAVDVEGLRYVVSVAAAEPSGRGEAAPVVHLRVYLIRTVKSGSRLPRVEVEEIGPRMDFRVGRVQAADEGMMKDALKRPKQLEARTRKNIETDIIGDKLGRIHTGKQDLNKMQSRKMKGLKRGAADDEEMTLVDGEDDKAKKARLGV